MLISVTPKTFAALVFVALILLFLTGFVQAQSLGDPVVKITFGSGTATRAGALAADSGSTSYIYSGSGEIGENYYTITNQVNTNVHGSFVTSYDHDYETNGGLTTGYMMVVNGNVTAGTVFTRKVTGLCSNTQYQFGVWIKNVLSTGGILPNMVFHIYAADGTTELGSGVSTGDVPTGNTWHNYIANFTLPAGNETVIIKLVSNASGTQGNDFAVDDITFSPYGSTVSAVFTQNTSTTQSTCAGSAQTYTINATSTLASGYQQKLQMYVNGTWTDLTSASTATSFSVTAPTTAGTYLYRLVSATAANISSSNCVVASNNLTLTVTVAPVAAFSNTNSGCLGSTVTFTDQSTTSGSAISSWTWDFGDGQTSTAPNPTHTYTAAGDYNVTLTVSNGNALCNSTSAPQLVHINAKPVAAFSVSTPACAGVPATLTDNSTAIGSSAITQWTWNYGDGTIETKTTNAVFTHIYAAAGTYSITLQVASGTCSSDVTTQNIVVNPLPVVDFSLPDVCLSDAFAQFNDLSTISDNTQAGFTYLWNFGDANATATNPNTSADKNPKHKYAQAGNYNVSLTVTSKYGCVAAVKTKAFTVNGAVPVAGFTVESSNSLCSSDAVIFNNNTSVDFGNITKIVMYYDYDSNPGVYSTYTLDDNTITASFSHNYGAFSSPLTKTYHVKMEAYSGGTCFATADKNIVVNANPSVIVSAIGPLCQEDAPVQIAANTQGFTGSGIFSGAGVSSTGLFNPATAGPGTFTISYLFTANTGCSYATSQQVIVYPTPAISVPASLTVLEGGQLTINASTTSTGLTYKWTPSTGLSDPTSLTPIANPSDDTQYTLTATSAYGCITTAQVFVSVLKAPVVPNTFTPNSDGINDTWNIKYLNSYPNATVEIFTRYGERVYSSVGYPTPWDGTYKNTALPVGVYYYVINPKNGRNVMSGGLTIIR
jgi:gliding motility-associated-like protein